MDREDKTWDIYCKYKHLADRDIDRICTDLRSALAADRWVEMVALGIEVECIALNLYDAASAYEDAKSNNGGDVL